MTTKAETKTKGMCIATRCTSVEQFIQMFHRFVDEESFFVSTLNTRPPGLETSFSVQLADGTPVLRGLCVVLQAWTNAANPFKTPGVRLGIKRLTANSMQVFEQLLITRSAQKAPPVPTAKPSGLAVVVAPKAIPSAAPRAIPKSPFNETAPTRHAPSRVEIKQPVRPSTNPANAAVPEQISAEPTDVIEEKTDVREPKLPPPRAASETEVTIPEPKRVTPVAAVTPVVTKPLSGIAVTPAEQKPVAPEPKPLAPAPDAQAAAMREAQEQAAEVAKPIDFERPADEGDRTPGSDLVLPANPLMGLNDESLEGYVECTLYEETGNYFSVDDDGSLLMDDVAPPPTLPANPLAANALDVSAATLAAASDSPESFDKNPETELAAKRFETSPKAPAYQDPATESRDSSPALVVPPPPPPIAITAKPDPAVIARGSMPVLDHEPVVAAPPVAHKSSQRWWLIGSALLLLAAAGVFVVTTIEWDKSSAAEREPVAKKQEAPVPPTQEPQVAPAPPPEDVPEDIPDEPTGDGPPIVGSGPCKVIVTSTPAGSMVALDGKTLGPSPLTVATTCDKHKIDIRHARYKADSKLVELTEGKDETVDLNLSRPTHIVTVTSNPSGATIFIDGRRAGTTPTKLSVLGFVTLKLELKKTGYQTKTEKFYSRYGEDKVSIKLNKW